MASSRLGFLGLLLLGMAPLELPYHLESEQRLRSREAIESGVGWLLGRQIEGGSFEAATAPAVPPVPITAMVLWAVSESDASRRHVRASESAARFLLARQQPDGAIADAEGGLRRYGSLVARQALGACRTRYPSLDTGGSLDLSTAIRKLDAYLSDRTGLESYDHGTAESREEIRSRVTDLLKRSDVSPPVAGALEFLRRTHTAPADPNTRVIASPPGTPAGIGYDELLEFIGELVRPESPMVARTCEAVRSSYTLERNPDLTRRFGTEGFRDSDAGLYYYYLTLARTLGALGDPKLRTVDGNEHDWARDLSQRLIELQQDEGFWSNENGRWWEDDPRLASCYAILALNVVCNLKERET